MEIVKKSAKCFFDGTPFKILYLLLTLLSFNSFTAHTRFLSVMALVVTALGGIVFIYRAVYLKRFIRTPNLLLLALFLVSFIITAIVNRQYGLLGNAKGLAWMGMQYCLLYACDERKKSVFYKREFHILSGILLVYLLLGVLGSYYFLATGQSGMFIRGDESVFYGFLWQRLWGVFSEPNNAATAMCIGIFIAFYLFKICQVLWIKIVSWVIIILLASYILFSDSRTALMCLMTGSAIMTYLLIINPEKRERKQIRTQVLGIVLAVTVAAASFFGIYFAKKGYNVVQNAISSGQSADLDGNKRPNMTINREQDLTSDFSNRRFDIWFSSVDVFKTAPIFGVGFRNIVTAAQSKAPDTYIVNNDQGNFASFHNMFLDVFASQGIVGIIIFAVFVILTLIWLVRLLAQKFRQDYTYVVTLFTIVMVAAFSGMVSPDIVYVNTQNAFLFWTFLGYLMHCARRRREHHMQPAHYDMAVTQQEE